MGKLSILNNNLTPNITQLMIKLWQKVVYVRMVKEIVEAEGQWLDFFGGGK